MKQVKLTTGEYLLVEVPEGQDYFDLHGNESPMSIRYNIMPTPGKFKSVEINLPPGQWEIIGRASELSSEAWKSILTKFSNPFMDWLGENIYIDYTHPQSNTIADAKRTATKSGISLIKSHSKNPETTLVIRKIK